MIILLTGTDTYRTRQKLVWLREGFRKKYDPSGYNIVTLDGETMTAAELRKALSAGGLFVAKRFVAIDGYQPKKSVVTGDVLQELFKDAAKRDDVIVALREVPSEPSDDRRKKKKTVAPRAALKMPKIKETYRFDVPTPSECASWLVKEAKDRGGQLPPKVANELVALCGTDTWRLANELDKLVAYADGRSITSDDLAIQIASAESSDIFALTDAVGMRHRPLAVRLLHQELAAGTNPLVLIASVTGHLWNLWRVQLAAQEKWTPDMMAKKLGLHPFVVQKAMAQAKTFPPEQIKRWHHQLIDTDATLKSTSLDAEALLDVMLLKN